ncbi:MAG: glycosyltransferase family 1 protein [Acidimicrobiales bacterium]
MIGVSINGKFLTVMVEGMPRVAYQVIGEIDRLLSQENYVDEFDVELLFPRGAEPPEYQRIRTRQIGRLSGQAWEQLEFPYFSRGRIGLNFLSTGPVVKRNCVTLLHDAQMFSTPASLDRKHLLMFRTLGPAVGHLHRVITTGSHFAKADMEGYRMIRPNRARVIYHAASHLDDAPADESVLDAHGLRGRPFILSHSLVQAHKNAAVVCRAYALIEACEVPLVLFGRYGPADFRDRDIPIPDNTVFVGRVSDGELKSLLQATLLFCFPSRTEGFGLPPLEAMYLGTPCVVSTGGALPEICGDGAVYAAPDDPAGWASAIETLLGDEGARVTLAERGRQRALSFSWTVAAQQYLDVLRELGTAGARRRHLACT